MIHLDLIIRRGKLSGLGITEHLHLAQRLSRRISSLIINSFFNHPHRRIQVVSSDKSRTSASLLAFVEGLPYMGSSLIERDTNNLGILHFHEDPKYQAYLRKDKQLKNKLHSIYMQPKSKRIARDVLERLFKRSFVDKLVNGNFTIVHNESGKSIKNEVDAVRMMHSLYLIGPNLREEGVGNLLRKYFDYEESAWLAYLYDAKVSKIEIDDIFFITEKNDMRLMEF